MSREGKLRLLTNAFLVLLDGRELGGGFFYAPGKAVTIFRNLNKPLWFTEVTVIIQTRETEHASINMRLVEHSEAFGHTLLECSPQLHLDHMQVRTFSHHDSSIFHPLVGAPLVVCVLEVASQRDSPELSQGRQVELSIFPAYGCKLSALSDVLLYDVRCWRGVPGAALVMYEGHVVGLHMRHVPVAAAPSNQASVALLCHVFVK